MRDTRSDAEAAAVWRRHLLLFRDEMLGRNPEAGRPPTLLDLVAQGGYFQ
jgi:hypothetical protein